MTGQELPILEYAEQMQISQAQIWDRVRQGKISARVVEGEVMIQSEKNRKKSNNNKKEKNRPGASSQWNPPEIAMDSLPPIQETTQLEPDQGSELALLIDHLSIAREECKESLSLARKTVESVKSMSEQLLAAKDQTIESLRHDLKDFEEDKHKLEKQLAEKLREIEDLKMLVGSMQ